MTTQVWNQAWFEMRGERRTVFGRASWVPLRAYQKLTSVGRVGELGFQEELFAVGTLAVSIGKQDQGQALGWESIGGRHQRPWSEEGGLYVPAEVYARDSTSKLGIYLVLAQSFEGEEATVWHLNQDLVIALELLREGDTWVRPKEGYALVARLIRDTDDRPARLEIKTEFLLDYLCARGMGLAVSTYRDRTMVVADDPKFTWTPHPKLASEITGRDRWEGRVTPIGDHNMPFGESFAVFHVGRTDEEVADDVPELGPPTDKNTWSKSWKGKSQGEPIFRVQGEHWHDEWIPPARSSPRVRDDPPDSVPSFILDATGKRGPASDLSSPQGKDLQLRWLWFAPDLVRELLKIRGATLGWHTEDTGTVALKGHIGFHFGINQLGNINILSEDVDDLPSWLQFVLAGHNITPDGGVSKELIAAQVHAVPADTMSPEDRYADALRELESAFKAAFGTAIFSEHAERESIEARVHRFRVRDRSTLFELAKDIARLTADAIQTGPLQAIVPPPKGEKWGSLKSLEKVLGGLIPAAEARVMMAPLVGTYDLRLADAHLPASDVSHAFVLAGVSESEPITIAAGKQLISNCASCLAALGAVFRQKAGATTATSVSPVPSTGKST